MPLNFPRHTKDSHFLTTIAMLIYNILLLPDSDFTIVRTIGGGGGRKERKDWEGADRKDDEKEEKRRAKRMRILQLPFCLA
jgi:hypothetical protein